MNAFYSQFMQTVSTLSVVIMLVSALVHVLFAAGIARDVNSFTRRNITTQLVPGSVWVIATLIGGVWVALAYWVVHHSSLSR